MWAHTHICAFMCMCICVCAYVCECICTMYSCAHVLSRVWVRACCRVHSLITPEFLQKKWTMCSLCIFKIYPFLCIFISSSFVIYSTFCLLVFVLNFNVFGGGVEHRIFFFFNFKSFLFPFLPPSFFSSSFLSAFPYLSISLL